MGGTCCGQSGDPLHNDQENTVNIQNNLYKVDNPAMSDDEEYILKDMDNVTLEDGSTYTG